MRLDRYYKKGECWEQIKAIFHGFLREKGIHRGVLGTYSLKRGELGTDSIKDAI